MASSGTIASPAVRRPIGSLGIETLARIKPESGREEVLVFGRTRIKSTAIIEAGDFTLRTIKTALFTPYDGPVRPGGPPTLYGSVNGPGSLMNSVRVRSFRGSIMPHTGTQHVGTAPGGTMIVNFMVLGA